MRENDVISAPDEAARLAALRRYDVLDSAPDALYDDVTRIAGLICRTPIALISLLDETRQWFKSRVGLAVSETSREIAFCDRAIRGNSLFEVTDARLDARFSDNPLVTGALEIRYYAGVPLATQDGHNLGTLCVLDRTPRELDPTQRAALEALSRQVIALLELRRAVAAERLATGLTAATLDALHDTIAVIDGDGSIVQVNRAWTEFASRNAQPPVVGKVGVGANYLTVCDQAAAKGVEVASQVAGALRRALRNPTELASFEYPCHGPADKRWYIARISAFRNGESAYAIVAHQNITARKLAERSVRAINETLEQRIGQRTAELTAAYASLRQSEEKFRTMFQNASVGFATATPTGTVLEGNTAFCVIAGREPAQLAGSDFGSAIAPLDRPQWLSQLARLRAGEMPGFVMELRMQRPDSGLAWVHASVAAVRDAGGQPTQIVALVQNLTQHKQALYERDRIFELSADMLAIAGYDGRLQSVNPAWTRLLGFSEAELLAMDYRDLMHPDDRSALDTLSALARGGIEENADRDVRMRTKDGTYRDIRWSATHWSGEARFVAVGRDVTRLRLSENKLRALAARLRNMREEERIAISRDIHDDLGQTLTALKMDLTLLGRDVATTGRLPDAVEFAAEIANMTNMVDSTLQSVRRIARQLRPEILDALGLLPALQWQAQDMQTRTGLRCTVDAVHGLPHLDIDRRTALFRIVQEALTNVARHAGALAVRVELVHAGGELRLSVQDDGCGFDASNKDAMPSLGLLGMSERAAMIGATFEVCSAPGKGTTITVRLPLAAKPGSNG